MKNKPIFFIALLLGLLFNNGAIAFIEYPVINPVAFSIAGFSVRWYGLMYLLGLIVVYLGATNYLSYYHKQQRYQNITKEQLGDFIVNGFLAAIVGGRLFYVIFYMSPQQWIHDPVEIIAVWHGGMSFHGGLTGAALLGIYTAYKHKLSIFALLDQVAPWAPFAIALGRFANFINDELWGRVTDVPWAVLFPNGGYLPRHPSQIYQVLLEGISLGILLLILTRRNLKVGTISGLFLILFGIARIIVEFFRMPDQQLGFFLQYFTMGQILSLPMLLLGLLIIYRTKK